MQKRLDGSSNSGALEDVLLGEDEQVMAEADALYHQTWRYPEQGIFLDMVSESADGAQKIASIRSG